MLAAGWEVVIVAQVTLQLDEAAIREATVQALAGKLTPEAQAKMIEAGIRNVLTPDTSGYGSRRTPLEDAFRDAVTMRAREIAREVVVQDEALQAKLRELMADTIARMLTYSDEQARTAFVSRLADAFVSTLRRD